MDQIVRPSFPADGFRGWRTASQHISHGSLARFQLTFTLQLGQGGSFPKVPSGIPGDRNHRLPATTIKTQLNKRSEPALTCTPN